MRNPAYSSVDPNTGNVHFSGPLSVEKGDHTHMPRRTEAYLPGDERGHLAGSALGGTNSTDNVVAQNYDVNHYSFQGVERGETSAISDQHASIQSERTAIVDGEVGGRPNTFLINDTVTYADGHTENLHFSFTNESYADQQAWNDQSAALPDTFDAPNPGDALRESMDPQAYAELMEETDALLPSLEDEFAPADYSGVPDAGVQADAMDMDAGASVQSDDGAFASSDDDLGADAGGEDGGVDADDE